MSEIQNSGSKGKVFAGIIIFFILFILLWVYVIGQNMNDVPGVG